MATTMMMMEILVMMADPHPKDHQAMEKVQPHPKDHQAAGKVQPHPSLHPNLRNHLEEDPHLVNPQHLSQDDLALVLALNDRQAVLQPQSQKNPRRRPA